MIVRLAATTAQIVTQVDHAVVSGQLAEAWGGDAVPALDPPDSVIAAARLHDIGWRHWEVEPRLNPDTGQPTNFLDVDIHEHLRLYRLGIEEVASADSYAGMLVSMHAAGIYTGRYGTQPALKLSRAPDVQALVDAFVAEQEASYEATRDGLGVSQDELWRNYVLLQVFDRLSLRLCLGDPAGMGPMEIVLPDDGILRVTLDDDGSERLSPWPFAQPELTVEIPTSTIDLDLADDALGSALNAATVERRPTTLRPA